MNNFKKLFLISAALFLGINEVWAVKTSSTEEVDEVSTQASTSTPQKKSSKKAQASKKKDSSSSYCIKRREDLYYRDDDISEYIDSFLQQNRTFRRFNDFTYMLSSTQEALSPISDQEDGNDYFVAIAPAIDTKGTDNKRYGISSTQGGFFLDKSLRRKSENEEILEGLVQFITSPDSIIDPNDPRDALEKKSQELSKNESRLETIGDVLNRGENNLGKIQEEINKELSLLQHIETDVFEELSLYISNPGDIHIKILFPFNISESHWLTGEVRLHRKGNQYECELYAHNPYGGGTMGGSSFRELEEIIRKRIRGYEPNACFTFTPSPTSPYMQRQSREDDISCGVIVAEDLLKRISGRSLENSLYPVNALKLRASQLKCVRKSNPDTTFIDRNQARIAHIGRGEKSQSKEKGASSDPLPKKSQVSSAETSSQEEAKRAYTFSPTTIKICSKKLEELRVQRREDCTVEDGRAYDSCYGRSMIFDVHNKLTKWRTAALERMRKFSDELEQFTLQNFVVASLKLKAVDLPRSQRLLSQRLNLPYVFFSGNPGEIERNILFTETEANNTNLPSSLPKSIQEKIKALLRENNIIFIANKYFHIEAPPLFATPFEEPLFVFRSSEKSSVLNFRKFIYSHFITEEEWTQIPNPFSQFNPIIKNLVTYSDGCSSYLSPKEDSDASKKRQTKKKQHSAEKEDPAVRAYNSILELALAEDYIIREKKDLMQAVFNEQPTDLFDAGKHDKGKSLGDKKLGMSFCFHQSEQSFLLYLLEKSTPETLSDFQSRMADFIIDHVNDNFSAYSHFLRRDTGESSPTGDAASSTNLDAEYFKSANSQPKPDSLSITTTGGGENLMSDEEFLEDLDIQEFTDAGLKPKPISSDDGTISSSTGPKEVIFKIDTNFDINFDIISPRHICKFCRGTFYLCQDKISLFLSTFLTQEGINLDNKNPLHKKISVLQKGNLKDALLKLKLNKITVNIFATSYKDVDNSDLMGSLK